MRAADYAAALCGEYSWLCNCPDGDQLAWLIKLLDLHDRVGRKTLLEIRKLACCSKPEPKTRTIAPPATLPPPPITIPPKKPTEKPPTKRPTVPPVKKPLCELPPPRTD